ncbi:helix-turn-helix domain-containing protein [Acinetobacter sp. HY1485]|uniref:helix-turn-helix domain-containing protein n=1 Tax=Acinetobacter sp. HY1485 TaxID=2970918 RepID=UPI0022B94D6A|nr:helix-turn-helix domain-containing protein [Acinetobacter sp. HY1485]
MNVRNSQSQSIVITVQDIQKALVNKHGDAYQEIISTVEKAIVSQALIKARGNQAEASRNLGINRNTLRSKVKKYGLV